ncbi:MAG: hypothetical protein CFE26_17275, partial [Verrucomicrobiales bacterium VVV1]
VPVITFFLVLQYGAYLRREIATGKMIWIWIGGAALYFGASRVLWFYDIYWDGVTRTFVPEFRFGDFLHTVGSFYSYVADYWMPMAGWMSLVAFFTSGVGALLTNKKESESGPRD